MDARTFFNLTREVRNLQKEYFKTRNSEVMEQCKLKEHELDVEIQRVTDMGF